jgi:hypothetical protein
MKTGLALLALLALSCADKVSVSVECVGAQPDIDCAVKHIKGKAKARACWEVRCVCENGARVTGKACQEIGAGETAHKLIPILSLDNVQSCDKFKTTEIANVEVDAK